MIPAYMVAAAAMITSLGGVVAVLVPILRNTKKIETIVNQQHTDARRYIIALSQQVIDLGGVPLVDQSQPVTGFGDAQPGQPT